MTPDTLMLKVTGRIRETRDTVTFLLDPGAPIPYLPGQFLTLLIEHYGQHLRRSYSLTSYPKDDPRILSITVKRVPNGEVSRLLIDNVHVGDRLTSLVPTGRFTLPAPSAKPRDLVFIAAGSGIAPVLPLLRQALDTEPGAHLWLIDQNHSESDIIFASRLDALQAQFPRRFILIPFLSTPESRAILPQRLTNATLEQCLAEALRYPHEDALFFCCGPEALQRMALFTLRLLGYSKEQFRQEHFTVDPPPHHPPMDNLTPRQVNLILDGTSHPITVSYPRTILQAALDAHIPLPYSCRGGRCSACAMRCLSGRVVMSINDVLTDRDLAEGWVLTCTGYAATDLELKLP